MNGPEKIGKSLGADLLGHSDCIRGYRSRCRLNALPSPPNVGIVGMGLTNTQTQRKAAGQPGLGQVKFAALIKMIDQGLIYRVASVKAEAN